MFKGQSEKLMTKTKLFAFFFFFFFYFAQMENDIPIFVGMTDLGQASSTLKKILLQFVKHTFSPAVRQMQKFFINYNKYLITSVFIEKHGRLRFVLIKCIGEKI